MLNKVRRKTWKYNISWIPRNKLKQLFFEQITFELLYENSWKLKKNPSKGDDFSWYITHSIFYGKIIHQSFFISWWVSSIYAGRLFTYMFYYLYSNHTHITQVGENFIQNYIFVTQVIFNQFYLFENIYKSWFFNLFLYISYITKQII